MPGMTTLGSRPGKVRGHVHVIDGDKRHVPPGLSHKSSPDLLYIRSPAIDYHELVTVTGGHERVFKITRDQMKQLAKAAVVAAVDWPGE